MKRKKLVLDTNVIVDCLQERDINLQDTRMLLTLGKVGEFSLWITVSQLTDLIYILSHGGKQALMPLVLEQLRKLLTFVRLYSPSAEDAFAMLETTWHDPEDAMIFEAAKALMADAIITSNAKDFESDAIPVLSSAEFFTWLKDTEGLSYTFMEE